jgi:plasmid stabilization system protein ParE
VKLEIAARAQRGIDRAAADYFRERPILGADFLAEVDYSLALLKRNPRLGHRVDDTYRRIHLRRFPYSLLYRLDLKAQLIRISVVGHQSRRPGYWRNRVEERVPLYKVPLAA